MDLFAEQQRMWRRMLNVPHMVRTAWGSRGDTTPHDVVLTERGHRLLRYRRETPATQAEPLLFCYALVNRPYILDLQRDRSVVQQYLRRGFDVYLIDWGVPSDADHVLTLADYVCGFLRTAAEAVLKERARDRLHLLGYCMGGTMSTMLAALEPQLVKTLTLLASPIDFGGRGSLLNLWAQREHFDVNAIVDACGNCPAWFLQACFLFMNPVQNLLEKNVSFYEQMENAEAITSYFALERWVNDNIPVAGEAFREFVTKLYQGNELMRGTFRIGGRSVDLGRIACPLLLLTAKKDHLVSPGSTEGLRPRVGSTDIESKEVDAGHVGLVVGGKAHRTLWPEATAWLASRSTSLSEPREGFRTSRDGLGPAKLDLPRRDSAAPVGLE